MVLRNGLIPVFSYQHLIWRVKSKTKHRHLWLAAFNNITVKIKCIVRTCSLQQHHYCQLSYRCTLNLSMSSFNQTLSIGTSIIFVDTFNLGLIII
jgi:hypothetical protein